MTKTTELSIGYKSLYQQPAIKYVRIDTALSLKNQGMQKTAETLVYDSELRLPICAGKLPDCMLSLCNEPQVEGRESGYDR